MTNVQHLLAELQRSNIIVKATDDNMLVIDAPKGTLTPTLQDIIAQNKSDIISSLKPKHDYHMWYKIVDGIANSYGLSVLDLLEYDAEGINDFFGNTAAIKVLCKSLADTQGAWHKHCNPSLSSSVRLASENLLVKCANCQFFSKDTVGSGEGIGHCSVGRVLKCREFPLYPNVERECNLYCSKQENNKL